MACGLDNWKILPMGNGSRSEQPGSEPHSLPSSRSSRASRRNEALRAKNRRAQARYRERQKEKFSDYKSAVEELTQQLEELSAEKDALVADKKMLESCLQVSYQKGITASADSEAFSLETAPSETYQHAIWKTARVDGPLLDAMLSVFAKARTACKLPPLSRQEVENTSLHEVFQRKEMCVEGTKALLNQVDTERTQAAFRELQNYMQEQADMFNLLYTQHGQLARVMEASHVQTSRAKHGMPTASFWAGVADALSLEEPQKTRMLHLRQQVLLRIEEVRAKRLSILDSFQGSLPPNINCDINGISFAGTFVQGTHSVDMLRQSLHQEHRTIHDFAGAIRRTVLSPYQHAILEVRSFPHKVDLLAICNALASQQPGLLQGHSADLPSLLSLQESHSGLVALEQMAAHLNPLDPATSQGLVASSSDAEAAHNWMPPVTDPLPLQPAEAVAETGAGLGSPQGSLKLRKSEMEALFMDL